MRGLMHSKPMSQVWAGRVVVPGVRTFDINADYVGGTADISELMTDTQVRKCAATATQAAHQFFLTDFFLKLWRCTCSNPV
jgi:hypothetical protein